MNNTCLGIGRLVESTTSVFCVVVVVVTVPSRTEEGTCRTGEKAHVWCTADQSENTERIETWNFITNF